jgi:hypothetical protein
MIIASYSVFSTWNYSLVTFYSLESKQQNYCYDLDGFNVSYIAFCGYLNYIVIDGSDRRNWQARLFFKR